MTRKKIDIKNSSLVLSHYEELRSQALENEKLNNNLGAASLLHRGMATWLQVLNSSEPSVKTSKHEAIRTEKFDLQQLHTGFVNSIANIILNIHTEVFA